MFLNTSVPGHCSTFFNYCPFQGGTSYVDLSALCNWFVS